MKTLFSLLAMLLSFTMAVAADFKSAQTEIDTVRHEVLLETSKGNIKVVLYNETPLHRDNFLKLVRSGFYDGLLFHRVIDKFMIQTGDSASRHAKPGELLGDSPEGYTVPAEIRFPQLYHKRGVLGAAREGDDVNPERASSASQFYIVYGNRFTDEWLDKVQQRLDENTKGKVVLPGYLREIYKKQGGTPHLDGQYTVFGEVLEGIDVVRDIEWVETDANDRPVEDVKIIKATVIK